MITVEQIMQIIDRRIKESALRIGILEKKDSLTPAMYAESVTRNHLLSLKKEIEEVEA